MFLCVPVAGCCFTIIVKEHYPTNNKNLTRRHPTKLFISATTDYCMSVVKRKRKVLENIFNEHLEVFELEN